MILIKEGKYERIQRQKTIKCVDCGQEFVFTAGEQAFYASKGLYKQTKKM